MNGLRSSSRRLSILIPTHITQHDDYVTGAPSESTDPLMEISQYIPDVRMNISTTTSPKRTITDLYGETEFNSPACKRLRKKIGNFPDYKKKDVLFYNSTPIASGRFGSVYLDPKDQKKIIKEEKFKYTSPKGDNDDSCSRTYHRGRIFINSKRNHNIINKFCKLFPKNLTFCHKTKYYKCNDDHEEGLLQVLLDKVDGITLKKYMSDCTNEHLLICVLNQLLYVCAYLNSKGIYHNDIKPSNIMIRHKQDTIELSGLKIGHKNITHNSKHMIPIPVLIDYGNMMCFTNPNIYYPPFELLHVLDLFSDSCIGYRMCELKYILSQHLEDNRTNFGNILEKPRISTVNVTYNKLKKLQNKNKNKTNIDIAVIELFYRINKYCDYLL